MIDAFIQRAVSVLFFKFTRKFHVEEKSITSEFQGFQETNQQ